MEIESKEKKISKAKSTSKPKPKHKIKTFDDYFQECIKNNRIPKDTPAHLKKALERVLREYQVVIKHEKSALENFAEEYVIEGKPGIIPVDYFEEKTSRLKEFFINLRNIKVRILMVCLIEQEIIHKPYKKPFYIEDKAYFQSLTYVNLEGTNIKKIIFGMINEIQESNTSEYQKHEPSGFCLYLKPLDGINKYFSPIVYAKQTEDADISDVFVKEVKSLTKVCK